MEPKGLHTGTRVASPPDERIVIVPAGRRPAVHPSGAGERPPDATPTLSIIIPTRNEAGNVAALLSRLQPVVLDRGDAEVIFVDDSTDDTPAVIEQQGQDYPCPVRLVHRAPDQRKGGLGGAVLAGMRVAWGQWLVVMDGDLQHPPEVIPQLLQAAAHRSLDLVVASRYCADGDAASFNLFRSAVSHGSTLLAKCFFPHRLHDVNDPMSGFFLVRREALNLGTLQPNGFKILLEIVGRTPGLRIGSVPFSFGQRLAGESKASAREALRLLEVLFSLRFGASALRFVQFMLVGVSGLVVNTLLLAFWTETLGIYYLLSLILATQGSSLWNFFLSERLVFRNSSQNADKNIVVRCALFLLMNNAALLARGPMVFGLTSLVGINYLVSNILSMVALLVIRYAVADSLIWRLNPGDATVGSAMPPLTQEQELPA